MESGGRENKSGEPYSLASKFSQVQERLSKVVYDAAQKLIWDHEEAELSVYRFKMQMPEYQDKPWFVAAVGEKPPDKIQQMLHDILSQGEMTALPLAILVQLLDRRAEQTKIAPWVERHYGSQGVGISRKQNKGRSRKNRPRKRKK